MMFITYLKKTIRLVLVLIIVIIFVRGFVIEPGRVEGKSMEDTFFDDDLFFVNKTALLFRTPERGDIVQFKDPQTNNLMIKRVVGLPGEKLFIYKNEVYIRSQNGDVIALAEEYLSKDVITKDPGMPDVDYSVIPTNEYFLLGDNRRMSGDSRYFGPVHRSDILGTLFKF